jgi:2'-5' RNA ligase
VRLFAAVETPDAVRQSLAAWIAPLQKACPRARWVPAANLHVTLKFIGDAKSESLDAIVAVLRAVRQAEEIEIHFRGAGFFPNEQRPRVLWTGIEAGAELAQLAQSIDRALEALGIAHEARDFRPHLTIARFPEKSDAAALARLRTALVAAGAPDFGSARVANFHLYRSVLLPSGAEYTRLDSFDFAPSLSAGR